MSSNLCWAEILKIRILSFLTVLLALCATTQVIANENSAKIRIALVGPFTGSYAGYGTQLLSGASQAVNDINQAGGLKGVALEIIPIDDQCNPDLALSVAAKIIKDKDFKAVIGHTCSAASLATSNLYAQANMLVITPTATNPKITQRHINTLFRMTGNDQAQSAVAANFIVHKLRSAKIAILHDQELYSKSLADLTSENLISLGKAPMLYQAIQPGTNNLNAIVKKVKKLEVDAIYFAGLYPEVSALALALHKAELQIPLISGDGLALGNFIQACGNTNVSDSVFMTFVTEPSILVSSQTVIKKMQQQHLDTSGYSLYAYASVQAIAQAIEQTNSTDGQALANWLHHNEISTVLGSKSWDTNGDIVASDFKIYAWHGEILKALES